MANMIFIDVPAGGGFSYAKTWKASRSSDSLLSLHVYDFMRKWLMEHPRRYQLIQYVGAILCPSKSRPNLPDKKLLKYFRNYGQTIKMSKKLSTFASVEYQRQLTNETCQVLIISLLVEWWWSRGHDQEPHE
nr:peptidase S10, serine carboxypeptidase, alpha/beta hydrolase fold protein [Tanacetum cinerariifolium]